MFKHQTDFKQDMSILRHGNVMKIKIKDRQLPSKTVQV